MNLQDFLKIRGALNSASITFAHLKDAAQKSSLRQHYQKKLDQVDDATRRLEAIGVDQSAEEAKSVHALVLSARAKEYGLTCTDLVEDDWGILGA